ncbi:MarR family winged helix-turn-helix transcriptional regulator [Rhodococcus sp. NCIMB 12038]|uniref:MarR family winged helix-turn-helix transcriptional regulator n=1 Tax=Rhodococcus sp. NCIMB 12038 TaxID=933800 RepID=UPI0015C5CEBF|nr:MarR family transcriptional regulator [Rhodococcus sp. NCIMB 12038]
MADEDPLALRFSAAPGHLLRRAQQVHTDYWSREIDEDITGPQYATLVSVAGWPEVDQKLAGELASLDKSTVAGVLARLEKKGWISRQRHPADARRRLLVLTEDARRRLPELTAGAAEVQRLLLQPLVERDRPEFIDLLQRVAFPDAESTVSTAPLRSVDVLEMSTTPGYLIRRAQQVHAAVWNRIFAGDLTSPQYAVLTAAATAGTDSVDQSQISLRASLDSSSVTDIVARLEEKGWITRRRDPGDRRRMRIHLTVPAVTAMRHLTRSVEQVQDELLCALDARERDRFVSLMQQVALIERDPVDRLPVGAG